VFGWKGDEKFLERINWEEIFLEAVSRSFESFWGLTMLFFDTNDTFKTFCENVGFK
jgi:hypothetical protein